MTPRQLHALEWAVENSQALAYGFHGERNSVKTLAARAALAQAWHEWRIAQSEKAKSAPRRMLQRVRAK